MNSKPAERQLREVPSSRESLWQLPRDAHKLVLLVADAQAAIDRGLEPDDCFQMNRQYWLQIDRRLKEADRDRHQDTNYKRLPTPQKQVIDKLDGLKFEFVAGMAGYWDQADPDQKLQGDYDVGQLLAEPRPESPWGHRSAADVKSSLQHRLNLAIDTDEFFWRDWLVATGRINPLQADYENYHHQIGFLGDGIAGIGEILAEIRGLVRAGPQGTEHTPVENHLLLLRRTLANAQGIYDQASQLAA